MMPAKFSVWTVAVIMHSLSCDKGHGFLFWYKGGAPFDCDQKNSWQGKLLRAWWISNFIWGRLVQFADKHKDESWTWNLLFCRIDCLHGRIQADLASVRHGRVGGSINIERLEIRCDKLLGTPGRDLRFTRCCRDRNYCCLLHHASNWRGLWI